jgi:hypothetical protein
MYGWKLPAGDETRPPEHNHGDEDGTYTDEDSVGDRGRSRLRRAAQRPVRECLASILLPVGLGSAVRKRLSLGDPWSYLVARVEGWWATLRDALSPTRCVRKLTGFFGPVAQR